MVHLPSDAAEPALYYAGISPPAPQEITNLCPTMLEYFHPTKFEYCSPLSLFHHTRTEDLYLQG